MSGKALGDLNVHPATGFDKNTALGKGSLTKSYIENINDNGPELQKKSSSPFSATINIGDAGSNGLETGNTEVEYIESENLADLPDVDTSFNVHSGPHCFLFIYYFLVYQHIQHGYTEVHVN